MFLRIYIYSGTGALLALCLIVQNFPLVNGAEI